MGIRHSGLFSHYGLGISHYPNGLGIRHSVGGLARSLLKRVAEPLGDERPLVPQARRNYAAILIMIVSSERPLGAPASLPVNCRQARVYGIMPDLPVRCS